MEAKSEIIKKGIADLLELPRDIVLDLPKITLVGNLQLYIENHKGIIEYSTGLIRINTKSGILVVTGSDLSIRTIVIEEIIVAGRIDKVEFLQ
ncbi:MAG TPA: sporulation protein YqfC [Clostridia bacterium]|nr:sporulation protein YqfC [Clostridia bacterium]